MTNMTVDLRVTLTIWLNAWEDLLAAERVESDLERVRRIEAATATLRDASTALHQVAEAEVEAAEAGPVTDRDALRFRARCEDGTPLAIGDKHAVRLLGLTGSWAALHEHTLTAKESTRDEFDRLEALECAMKRVIDAARLYARRTGLQAGPASSMVSPRANCRTIANWRRKPAETHPDAMPIDISAGVAGHA